MNPNSRLYIMLERLRDSTLRSGLVLFWALWLTLVTVTNLTDALKQFGLLPDEWKFASYNYALVVETVGAFGVPASIAAALFGGVILWQVVAAGLLWRAFGVLRRGGDGQAAEVTQAFVVNLALWSAFLIATELTVNYVTAGTHKGTLLALLATLLVLRSGTPRPDVPFRGGDASAAVAARAS
jgi:hypothetical protein